MNIQKTILALAVMALGLVGCGTEEQDNGNNISARSTSNGDQASGVVVDGPVVRGLVFLDLNDNLKKDSFEPSALTDNNGYFGSDPVKGINYCSSTSASANNMTYVSRPEFCLNISPGQFMTTLRNENNTKIIITGGYDLYTGEPFEGSMSKEMYNYKDISRITAELNSQYKDDPEEAQRRIDNLNRINGLAITPLSSIARNNSDTETFLKTLGIEDTNLNFLNPADPEGDGQADNFQANKFAVTYQMHKFVTVVAAWVKNAYPEIGDNDKLPSDVSNLVYKQFENFHKGDFNAAWSGIFIDITALYLNAGVELKAPIAGADIYANLAAVNTAIVSAFGYDVTDGLGSELTFDNVKARVRGVEVVVLKIIRGLDHTAALAALKLPAYLANLAGNGADNGNINFTQLVEFSGDANALAAESALAATNSGVSLSELAGKSLSFEDEDPSVNSKAAIFFTGTEGATKGEIHLCLKYEGDSDVDLDGNYISGSWDTIPALNNTVLLEMNIFGGTSAVLKKVGEDGTGATQYRFDYAEKITKFSSAEDFEVTTDLNLEAIPNSNETCQTYLGLNAAP